MQKYSSLLAATNKFLKLAQNAPTVQYSGEKAKTEIQNMVTNKLAGLCQQLSGQGVQCTYIGVDVNITEGTQASFEVDTMAVTDEAKAKYNEESTKLLNSLIPQVQKILKKYNVKDTFKFNIQVTPS